MGKKTQHEKKGCPQAAAREGAAAIPLRRGGQTGSVGLFVICKEWAWGEVGYVLGWGICKFLVFGFQNVFDRHLKINNLGTHVEKFFFRVCKPSKLSEASMWDSYWLVLSCLGLYTRFSLLIGS